MGTVKYEIIVLPPVSYFVMFIMTSSDRNLYSYCLFWAFDIQNYLLDSLFQKPAPPTVWLNVNWNSGVSRKRRSTLHTDDEEEMNEEGNIVKSSISYLCHFVQVLMTQSPRGEI